MLLLCILALFIVCSLTTDRIRLSKDKEHPVTSSTDALITPWDDESSEFDSLYFPTNAFQEEGMLSVEELAASLEAWADMGL
jgi:hypothetical protein